MNGTLYLLILFDEDQPAVPSKALHQYVEKKTWTALADSDIITALDIYDFKYQIVRRRSMRMDDLSGPRMVLVMDIKKLNEKATPVSEPSGHDQPGPEATSVHAEFVPGQGTGR